MRSLCLIGFIVSSLLLVSVPVQTFAQPVTEEENAALNEGAIPEFVPPTHTFIRGKIQVITEELPVDASSGALATQTLAVTLASGKEVTIEYSYVTPDDELQVGETVVIDITSYESQTLYAVADRYRLPGLIGLTAVFFLLAIGVAGRRGAKAILGLVVGFIIIFTVVLPGIKSGNNPLIVSLVGSAAIAIITLYLAHGRRQATTIALIGTLLTLVLSVGLAVVAVNLTKLTGLGSEEAFYLQVGTSAIALRGLLLGGIILGVLGILDDITTAQVALIAELRKANPRLSKAELYRSGLAVGREHIASLVNTLVLAYVGTSLPLLLLVQINSQTQPLWTIINSQIITEELVRALVGSMTLIVAVPLTTLLAVRFIGPNREDETTPRFWQA